MTDDLSDFKGIFIAECHELLEGMEKDLLDLSSSNANQEVLNAIFRGAHSMKGGAGALGFKAIFTFTHSMEALLDEMREGKIAPTQESIDVLLAAVDVVRQMVRYEDHNTTPPDDLGQDILQQIEQFLHHLRGEEETGDAAIHTEPTPAAFKKLHHYHISFTPHRQLFSTGNDPLFILKQLQQIATCHIHIDTNAIPPLSEINPEECYLRWDIDCETDQEMTTIRELFEFVEDHADISITEEHAETTSPAPTAITAPTPVAATIVPATPANTQAAPPAADKDSAAASVRVDTIKIDKMVNMVGELVIAQSMLMAKTETLPAEIYLKLVHSLNDLSRRTRELQEAVMAVRMQPVKSIFSRMTRLVRDLARQLDKQIRLVTFGENTEIDKTIIEKLSDPITHMIRNSADHGLESTEKRIAKGKPQEGTIRLSAYHLGSKIVIAVEDDGAGINREKVFKKACEKGLVAADANLSPTEIDSLIFLPGFSTTENVSTISGRGVGMDVVDKNIKELGGSISTHNTPGQGLRFTITLPLTLAILDGMVVALGEERYIVPVSNILETLRPAPSQINTIAGKNDMLNLRGEFIPILYLYDIFQINTSIKTAEEGLVIILESGRDKFGLVVDSLLGQQQVVIKTIDANSGNVPGISGATILGDGKVSLILEVPAIYKMLSHPAHTVERKMQTVE